MDTLPKFAATRLQERSLPAESHPDANLLAAFAERSLAGSERALVVEHIAACGDCREAVALAMPATESVDSPVLHRSSRLGWAWPKLGWAALAAGILVVTSIGIKQYSRQEKTVAFNVAPSNSVQQNASPDSSAVNQRPSPKALAQSAADQKVLVPDSAAPARRPQRQSAIGRAMRETGRVPEPAEEGQAGAALDDAAKNQNQLAQNRPEVPFPGSAIGDLNVVKAKAPVPEQAAADSPAAAEIMPSTMVRAPRWEIAAAGALQRSFDGGNTWENVDPSLSDRDVLQQESKKVETTRNSNPVFRAVSANDLEVWAGASGGTLYHSLDGGNRWALVSVADSATILTGDITGIQFADPQHGKVATSSSELWTTSDTGQTWHRQQ
ncbi:MAG: YCF48-related protein [Candidatus Sulfotelmatobacter sp.]